MALFVLINRPAGLFTNTRKHASRTSVANVMSALGSGAKVVSDNDPKDLDWPSNDDLINAFPATVIKVAARS
jgi:hypothetical protein